MVEKCGRILGTRIIWRRSPKGWAVVIPDQVLIDSYHHPPHLHKRFPKKEPRVEIEVSDLETVLEIVRDHLRRSGGEVDVDQLCEELRSYKKS